MDMHCKFCDDLGCWNCHDWKRPARIVTAEKPSINRIPPRIRFQSVDFDGRCDICGSERKGKRNALDHDHQSGRTRGVLCVRCNSALGFMRDNPAALSAAADYLEATHYCCS